MFKIIGSNPLNASSPPRSSHPGFSSCFVYISSPTTLSQLLELKATHPDARIVVGNSELAIEQKLKGRHYPVLISAARIPELLETRDLPNGVMVGASTTWTELTDLLRAKIAALPEHQVRSSNPCTQTAAKTSYSAPIIISHF